VKAVVQLEGSMLLCACGNAAINLLRAGCGKAQYAQYWMVRSATLFSVPYFLLLF
jgi:hypothetical protein